MLNYFRSKKTLNRQIDELENKCAVLSGKLRGIGSINNSLFKDYQSVNELNKNLNSENARLRELTNYSNSQDLKIQELLKERELIKTLKERIYILEETLRIRAQKTPDTAFISEDVVKEPLSAMLEAARKEAAYYKIRARENEEKRIKEEKLQKEMGDLIKENIIFNNKVVSLTDKIKQLEAENLGLLNKIANDNKFHDPDLKIDLTKPIRYKHDGNRCLIHIARDNRYHVKDINGIYYGLAVDAKYINENYENYEPEAKPVTAQEAMNNAKEWFKDYGAKVEDTGLGVNPLSVKNIVPKQKGKYEIGEEKDRVSLSSEQKNKVPRKKIVWGGYELKPKDKDIVLEKEVEELPSDVNHLVWVNDGEHVIKPAIAKPKKYSETFNEIKDNAYTIIDMTKKSKAVREFLKAHLFRVSINEGMAIMDRAAMFNTQDLNKYRVTRDNIRKMMKKYIDKGLIETSDYHYVAAKPLKIILEKEK